MKTFPDDTILSDKAKEVAKGRDWRKIAVEVERLAGEEAGLEVRLKILKEATL